MKKTLLLLLLAVASLFPACKKSNQADDPCAGFAWLTAPIHIGVVFVDKTSGENILISKNIDVTKITITSPETQAVGKITNLSSAGAVMFLIEQTKKGDFKYNINIPELGTTAVTYTSVERTTGVPCHPTSITVGEPVVEGHTYTVERQSTNYIVTVKM
jgi:hypothetical protein